VKIVMACLSAALAAVISTPALAAAGWSGPTPILEINQQPPSGVGANLVFIETNLIDNPSGCSHSAGFYFDITDDRGKRLFAMLVAAQLAGRNVKIYTDGTCHSPWNYARLDGLVLN
jgi:hypothetical protein